MGTLRTPRTAVQCRVILDALKTGRAITPASALDEYGCFRLAARIWDLRQAGHDIVTYWESDGHKRWASYKLLKSARA